MLPNGSAVCGILVVDDHGVVREGLIAMLKRQEGIRVLGSAASGEEAIDIFTEFAVDLVMTDYDMPHMNGTQPVNRLKQIAPHIPMIMLGDPRSMAGEMHSADALLCKKTIAPAEILERIKVMAARKRGPSAGYCARRREAAAQRKLLAVTA